MDFEGNRSKYDVDGSGWLTINNLKAYIQSKGFMVAFDDDSKTSIYIVKGESVLKHEPFWWQEFDGFYDEIADETIFIKTTRSFKLYVPEILITIIANDLITELSKYVTRYRIRDFLDLIAYNNTMEEPTMEVNEMERKLPPILWYKGEKVIPEARVRDLFKFNPTTARSNWDLCVCGRDYVRISGDEGKTFVTKNRDGLEETYQNEVTRKVMISRLIGKTGSYFWTESGLKRYIFEPEDHECFEWLSKNYFHPEKQEQKSTTETILKGYDCMNAKDLLTELSKGIQELNRMEESAMKQLQEIQAEKQAIKNQLKAILQEAE